MKADQHITHLIYAEGVNQEQRLLKDLRPESVPVDGRNLRDRLEAAYVLAGALRFMNLENLPGGDWRPFWATLRNSADQLPPLSEIERQLATTKQLNPHLTLFIAFVRMFEQVQGDLNKLSKRHLDFFYEEVLRINRKEARNDQVHVVFSPAKNVRSHLLSAGSLLNAGTGSDGQPLHYALDREFALSQSQAVDFRSVWVEKDRFGRSRLWSSENDTEASFAPFGTEQLDTPPEQRSMQDARIGFAIASAQLLMREGDRTVNITIQGKPVSDAIAGGSISGAALKAIYTGPKGWYEAPVPSSQMSWSAPDGTGTRIPTLRVTLSLEAGDDAIELYVEDLHQEGMETEWPVLKLELDPEAYAYDGLIEFQPDNTTIAVSAEGLEDLFVQTDLGVVDASQPFLPFGPQPVLGANCYIGNEEIFRKPLTHCEIHLHWADLPTDLQEHYQLYNRLVNGNSFYTTISLRQGRKWENNPLKFQEYLFKNEVTGETDITITQTEFNNVGAKASLDVDPLTRLDSKTRDGFIRLSLTGAEESALGSTLNLPFKAFGHQVFSPLFARQAMDLSQHLAQQRTTTTPELPPQPYTPKIDSLSIDYSASLTEDIGKPAGKVRLFSLDAFGHLEVSAEDGYLLPQYRESGYCFIGLENCVLPQQVNLLIDVSEVPAPPEGLPGAEGYQWRFLGKNGWETFEDADVLEEGTLGLRQRGIVSLNLLGNGEPGPLLPQEKVWLSVEANEDSAASLRWQAVYSQAALANLVVEEDRDLTSHLTTGLASESISRLVKKDAAVKKVLQPFASFGGRPEEPDDAYYLRVSERLRHRQRAVNPWDYERLILEEFPTLYKVACLNHYAPGKEVAPGNLTVVVVPDWRNQAVANPLMPTVDVVQREKMAQYLGGMTPPQVTIHVENPLYEQLLVDAQVSLREGFDPGYYLSQLNIEIQQYLSPWAFSERQDIPFGGTVYKSEILALLEGLPYVDYVASLKLYHIHDGTGTDTVGRMRIEVDFEVAIPPSPLLPDMTINETLVVGRDVDAVTSTRRGSILVSHPQHRLHILQQNELHCPGTDDLGIGFMMVEVDFEVQADF